MRSNYIAGLLFWLLTCSVQANDWQYTLTPYLWGAANTGQTGTPAAVADVDISFSHLIDHLEWGGMLNFSATKGNWLLFSELTLLQVSDSQTSSKSIPLGNINTGVELEIFGQLYDFAAGYRFYSQPDVELYGYAGIRYMDIEADFSITTSPVDINLSGTLGDDWIDPIIGLHGRWSINDRFALQGRVEAGGFSSQPQESYMLTTTVNHRLSERWSLNYFYRYMKVDYASESFVYDMEVTGPGVGASYRF